MGRSLKLWDFVELCERAQSVADVKVAFVAAVADLGFANFGLCTHIDPSDPPAHTILFFQAPRAWVEEYEVEGYCRINPVFFEAERRPVPFRWSDPDFLAVLSPAQATYMQRMADAGVFNGITFPLRSANALAASCSLIPGPDGVDATAIPLGYAMGVFAYESAQRLFGARIATGRAPLTPRERECLVLVARGKSDWAISEVLGLSEGVAHRAIERAKQKFGVATRVQAVVRAIHAGEISVDETTQ
jgi:DNA-binding CsgD family transcriptional regulator